VRSTWFLMGPHMSGTIVCALSHIGRWYVYQRPYKRRSAIHYEPPNPTKLPRLSGGRRREWSAQHTLLRARTHSSIGLRSRSRTLISDVQQSRIDGM